MPDFRDSARCQFILGSRSQAHLTVHQKFHAGTLPAAGMTTQPLPNNNVFILYVLQLVMPRKQSNGHPVNITSMCLRPCTDCCVHFHHLLQHPGCGVQATQSFRSHQNWIVSVAWSPASQHHLVTASHDKTLKLWDTRTSIPLHTLTGHTHKVRAHFVSSFLFAFDRPTSVIGWDAKLWAVTGTPEMDFQCKNYMCNL